MSTDSGWGDYLSADTPVVDTFATSTFSDFDSSTAMADPIVSMPEAIVDTTLAEPVLPDPVVDVVESELTGAAADQDWSSWHAESGNDWANSAQDWVDYANESAAGGYFEAANSAMETAADHAAIADQNFAVADDYSAATVDHLEAAAAEVAPYADTTSYDSSTGYDAMSYDSTSYDTTSYDTGASYDTGMSYDVAE